MRKTVGAEIRCPVCGKKLAERLEVSGRAVIAFYCPRCRKTVKIEKKA